MLLSVFPGWQTRENLSYSTSAPVQLPRSRLLHRLAFPCSPPLVFRPAAAIASTSVSVFQVDECLINDGKLGQEGRNGRN